MTNENLMGMEGYIRLPLVASAPKPVIFQCQNNAYVG